MYYGLTSRIDNRMYQTENVPLRVLYGVDNGSSHWLWWFLMRQASSWKFAQTIKIPMACCYQTRSFLIHTGPDFFDGVSLDSLIFTQYFSYFELLLMLINQNGGGSTWIYTTPVGKIFLWLRLFIVLFIVSE